MSLSIGLCAGRVGDGLAALADLTARAGGAVVVFPLGVRTVGALATGGLLG